MAEQGLTNIRAVQRNVLRFSLLGVVVIAVLSAVFVMLPMYGQLKDAARNALLRDTQSKADAVSQYIIRTKNTARQISSRTQARRLLTQHEAGRISAEVMSAGLNDILGSALRSSREMTGIARLNSEGVLAISVGTRPDPETWPDEWRGARSPLIKGPVFVDGEYRLLVSSPILDPEGRIVGTDIVAFAIDPIFRLFRRSGRMGESGQAYLVFPDSDGLTTLPLYGADDASVTSELRRRFSVATDKGRSGVAEDGRFTFAHSPVRLSNWTLVLRQDVSETFGQLNNNLIFSGVGVIGMILLGMCGLFLIVSPLTARIETLSDSMEIQLRLALDNMPNGLCMYDEDLTFTAFNRGFQEMYGFKPGFLHKGLNLRDAMRDRLASGHFGEIDDVEAEISERLAMVQHGRGSVEHHFADGRIIEVRFGDWTDGYVVGVYTDITQRKKAEDRLAESEARMRAILEASPIATTIIDLETQERLYANPATLRTMGAASMGQLIGKSILHTHARDDTLDRMRTLFERDGKLDNFEVERRKLDGRSTWWALANWRPITYMGRDAYIVWNLDITKRKRAEETVARQSAILQSTLENMPSGLVVLDEKLTIVEFNPQYERLWRMPMGFIKSGRAFEEVVNHLAQRGDFDDLTEATRARAVKDRVASIRRGGANFEHRNKDGTIIQVSYSQWSGGYLVGLFTDITEQKRIEQVLTEAKHAAEEASAAKSAFLANVSHEIRTPLNAIIGLARLALRTELTEQQGDYLSKVQSSSQSLLGIINDILDFSKIEAGKMEMEVVDFKLDNVLTDLSAIMLARAGEKPLELLYRTDPDVPLDLRGDPLRLGQVLINLVANAIKFTDTGEILVTAGLDAWEGDRVRLRFEVTDTGIGMTDEQIEMLFQPFTQADVSTTRKFGGTGLGLAISHRLVDMMHGNIGCESVLGEGSTFWFTATFEHSTAGSDNRLIPSPDLRGMRTLIVDDNETARAVFSESLSAMTLDCTSVDGGLAAISELVRAADGNKPYGLVLLDWQMPDMDGMETAKQISRMSELNPKPAIIMVSAHDRDSLRAQARNVGIDTFLVKPINQSTLFDAAMQAVTGRQEPDDRPAASPIGSSSEDQVAGLRVLLVEDNESNQQVAAELLTAAGVEIEIAANGRIALERLDEIAVDAVLMDLQMPEMDGFEATRRLRAETRFKDLPIIAMTAHAMAAERNRCLAVGMNDHVTKPIDPDRLFRALARWAGPGTQDRKAPRDTPRQEDQDAAADHASTKAPTGETPSLPEKIAGIDMSGARALLRDNDILLRHLLSEFHGKYMDTAQDIADSLADGDVEAAQRNAHTIKGVSGNIRAVAVFEAAKTLEDELRRDPASDRVLELVSGLAAALAEVRNALDRALAP